MSSNPIPPAPLEPAPGASPVLSRRRLARTLAWAAAVALAAVARPAVAVSTCPGVTIDVRRTVT
ncbi:hypothetical protein [Brachybacterium squillarum]|uniref:hypothetical protein n=1 Tax=Brachybacterium squillarum TaxID=661979 RepID=UPI0002629395|nr:hypothetical protein [Brachybacterium squillarum]